MGSPPVPERNGGRGREGRREGGEEVQLEGKECSRQPLPAGAHPTPASAVSRVCGESTRAGGPRQERPHEQTLQRETFVLSRHDGTVLESKVAVFR